MNSASTWQRKALSAAWPVLEPGQLHIYAVRSDCDGCALPLRTYLSQQEIKRAESCLQAEDQRRSMWSRGILRYLLGQYLGIKPAAVAFSYSDSGKPYVDLAACGRHTSDPVLHFNVSHSGDWLLYSFSLDVECGVDIEFINNKNNVLSIAGRFFHHTEVASLKALDPSDQVKAFYKLWACKEAYAKASGQTLFQCISKSMGLSAKNDKKLTSHAQASPYFVKYIDGFCGYAAAWCWMQACSADVQACVLDVG